MMQFVAGDDIGKGSDAHLILIGYAAAAPGSAVEIAKQGNRGAADSDVVLDQIGQGTVRPGAVANIVVLLVAFDRSGIAARNTQGAVGHDAFGIVDVSENLLQTPLLR